MHLLKVYDVCLTGRKIGLRAFVRIACLLFYIEQPEMLMKPRDIHFFRRKSKGNGTVRVCARGTDGGDRGRAVLLLRCFFVTTGDLRTPSVYET